MSHERRQISKVRSIYRPINYFENLCNAATEQQQLNTLRSAHFVTDVDTLWALFSTIHTRVSQRLHEANYVNPGFCIAAEVVNGTIFMKIMNIHHCNDYVLKSARAHIEKSGLRFCHATATQRNLEPQNMPNKFKRVIKYGLGEIKMVIEDDRQVLSIDHHSQALSDGVRKCADGTE